MKHWIVCLMALMLVVSGCSAPSSGINFPFTELEIVSLDDGIELAATFLDDYEDDLLVLHRLFSQSSFESFEYYVPQKGISEVSVCRLNGKDIDLKEFEFFAEVQEFCGKFQCFGVSWRGQYDGSMPWFQLDLPAARNANGLLFFTLVYAENCEEGDLITSIPRHEYWFDFWQPMI